MKLKKEHLSKVYEGLAEKDESFQYALKLVRANTNGGNIWVIGSQVYKNLINHYWGLPPNHYNKSLKDYDFLIESPQEEIRLPFFWRKTINNFGNPKFHQIFGRMKIDFVPLDKVHSVNERRVSPSIENYLAGVPLNIHSIVYDTKNQTIEGEVGIQSLEQKIVRVNNLQMAEDTARRYNITINELIKKIAEKLSFQPEFI